MRAKYVVLLGLTVSLLGLSTGVGGSALRKGRESVGARRYTSSSVGVSPVGSVVNAGVRTATRQGGKLPLLVDGAQTPDLVPDDVAYRHFILLTAVSATATANDVARRDAFLARVGLSPADRTAYLGTLSQVKDQLADIEAQQRSDTADEATL